MVKFVSRKDLEKRFKTLLLSVDREGIRKLIEWLDEEGFFQAPASSKYHGSYKGGLMEHSYNVYLLYKKFTESVEPDSIKIVSLLHDICKINKYVKTSNGYDYNKDSGNKAEGEHGIYSINLIKKFIYLTHFEAKAIKYHMGMYYSEEFQNYGGGEYTINDLFKSFENEKVKMLYLCDELESSKSKLASPVKIRGAKE